MFCGFDSRLAHHGPVAQLATARACKARTLLRTHRRFESSPVHQFCRRSEMAQHCAQNAATPSSNLGAGTTTSWGVRSERGEALTLADSVRH